MAVAHQTRGVNIRTRDQMAKALAMRRDGFLLRQIADAIGCDLSTASKMIKKALKEIVREPAEQVLQLELDRLDSMFVAAYARASNQSIPFDRDAIETCLKVMERRARLLGIDKPAKVASTDPSGEQEASAIQIYIPANDRDVSEQ